MKMKMEIKIAFLLMLFMIMSASLWAQSLPGSIWASPQSNATEGRYRSNADDFIRPDTYSGLKFNKWFGITAFMKDSTTDSIATLGIATKINNLYMAAFYSGNFWAGTNAYNYTERMYGEGSEPAGGVANKTYDVYTSAIDTASGAVNNFALLLGFADMGIRLTYRTKYQSFDESNIVIESSPVGDQLYKNYYIESGYMAPQIAWAMSKDLVSGKGIRPYLTADLYFYRDYKKTETSSGISGEKIDKSANYLSPSFAIGLGSYHFYNKDGFRGSFDLEYTLSFNIYDNEYTYYDIENDVYKKGSIEGTNSGSFVEKSYFTNTLTPSIAGAWSKEKLALRFKLNFPLTYTNKEDINMMLNNNYQLIKAGNSDETTTFTFRPDLRLAMQYKIIPNRLILNTGARIQATAITLETVDHELFINGSKSVIDGSKKHNNSYGGSTGLVSRFSIGPTLYFTENFWVETNTGVTNVYGDNAIEVFGTGTGAKGLFSFGSVLVCLKF